MTLKELVYDENAILHLYEKNGWTAYTKKPAQLFAGIRNSLYAHGAYDGDTLVGLIRVFGDGETVIYIQDILILPDHQRQGIGTKLMKVIFDKYAHVNQIILTTDLEERQKAFYESVGFQTYETAGIRGFIKLNR